MEDKIISMLNKGWDRTALSYQPLWASLLKTSRETQAHL